MTAMHHYDEWVYLDNNATTHADSRVIDAMLPYLRENFANPSSAHALGVVAANALRVARPQVQSLLGASHEKEVIFTSGGSESNNTAILSAIETQTGRDEIITSTVEHPAILAVCDYLERSRRAKIHRIPVDDCGRLDLDAYKLALNEKTAVVSIQWANNETGTLFPIGKLAELAHEAGALFHCDAVQAAGKLHMDMQTTPVDMLSISAHKLHGPMGIGVLYLRNGVPFRPLIHGGQQERRRRAGTENTAAIVGFGVAAELAGKILAHEMTRLAVLRDSLQQGILRLIPGAIVIGDLNNRLPNTLNIAFEDVEADSLLLLLDRAFIAISSGSACASGAMKPSHVMRAMKVPFAYLRGAIRFSFSRENTEKDVARVLDVLPQLVKDLRSTSVPLETAYS